MMSAGLTRATETGFMMVAIGWRCAVLWVLILAIGSAGDSVRAQSERSSDGIGEAEAIAAAIQGEYSGRVRDFDGYTGRLGLQVVARGSEEFEAVLFRGGLPFDGWDRRTRLELTGRLTGTTAMLTDRTGSISVEIDASRQPFAWISDSGGQRRGGLVRAERRSRTLDREPPAGAQVLFRDGQITGLSGARLSPAGFLAVGCLTEQPVGDFVLHLEFRLPFDLMIGVNRRVYRTGVFQGQDLFDQRTSLIQYAELFNAFPEVTFPISVLASVTNQELVSYAWIFPNVVANGHWWYSNTPTYIEHDLAGRLEAIPQTKQVGYYSDMYKLEFAQPKFAMYKRVLAKVLAEKFVVDRSWTETQAIALGTRVLRDNTEKVFGVKAG